MPRLRRRIRKKRLNKRAIIEKLFAEDIKKERILTKARQRIKEKILQQPEIQIIIGDIREQRVLEALQNLQEKGEIRGFEPAGNLSYANLIEGIDFTFVYVTSDIHKTCPFSVTGERWIDHHKERHPEIPVIAIDIWESRESIERKILALRNNFH